jgi:Co/Zn/Cd efflux system component
MSPPDKDEPASQGPAHGGHTHRDQAHDHDHHGHSHDHHFANSDDPKFRKALWFALALNAAMFLIEIGAGLRSGSVSLLADAIDFGGDAANYAVSIWAIGAAVVWRSRTALLKGLCMVGFGLAVLTGTLWAIAHGVKPEPITMGIVGFLALAVNLGVAFVLYAFREGDANMRSVWLCTRNDAIGNVLVLMASVAVAFLGSGWPDHLVALFMAGLAIRSGLSVIQLARRELS